MALELTEKQFQQDVLESLQPVVVKVYAEWCPPCKVMAPAFEAVAKEYSDRVRFFELNVDNERNLAVQLGIISVPTTLFVKSGRIVSTSTGALSRDEIADKVQALLEA